MSPGTLADKLARFWVIGQLLILLQDADQLNCYWVGEFTCGCTSCIQICRPEYLRKLRWETIQHVVTPYLVTQRWLEIIGIVSDRGSKESIKVPLAILLEVVLRKSVESLRVEKHNTLIIPGRISEQIELTHNIFRTIWFILFKVSIRPKRFFRFWYLYNI